MTTVEQVGEIVARLKAIEDFIGSNRLPPSPTGERSIAKAIVDMEIYVKTLIDDPPFRTSELRTSMFSEFGVLIDEKIKTAMSTNKGGNQFGEQ